MRRAAAVDENQPALVSLFRMMGWSVQVLSTVGQGCTDLVIAKHGLNIMVEIKNPKKPPSARGLTPDQIEWHAAWRGTKCVIESAEDVTRINHEAFKLANAMKAADLTLALDIGRATA